MFSGYNSETLHDLKWKKKLLKEKNAPNPWRGAIWYCRAAHGIERVSEWYPEDILRNPVVEKFENPQSYKLIFWSDQSILAESIISYGKGLAIEVYRRPVIVVVDVTTQLCTWRHSVYKNRNVLSIQYTVSYVYGVLQFKIEKIVTEDLIK